MPRAPPPHHLRELGLAAPGTDEQVARIVSRPLDRARGAGYRAREAQARRAR